MMGWMEALGITRLGGGADRASLANSGFESAHSSAVSDIYSSVAPAFSPWTSVEAWRGASGRPKMTGFAVST